MVQCSQSLAATDPMITAGTYALMINMITRLQPKLVIVDMELPQLNGFRGIASITTLNTQIGIIVLGTESDEAMEAALFRLRKVRGVCRSAGELTKALPAVIQGELWIRRRVFARLMDEAQRIFSDDAAISPLDLAGLDELTRREREIATLVGRGDCNKDIAQRLAIKEGTVKFHLTEIFRKLGVADRVGLALHVNRAKWTDNAYQV